MLSPFCPFVVVERRREENEKSTCCVTAMYCMHIYAREKAPWEILGN
jgi:hypothetical protein